MSGTDQLLLDRGLAPPRGPGAPCRWCGDPIPHWGEDGRQTRSDALTCCKDHRQADWRFGYQRPQVDRPELPAQRFAYADPPYPGCSRYYKGHPDYAGEVDHAELLDRLERDFPDGWALSTSSRSLGYLVELLEGRQLALDRDVRLGIWSFPQARPLGDRPRRSWEPVLFRAGRPVQPGVCTLDSVHAAPPRALPGQVIGSKPGEFAYWVFANMGAMSHDELVDLFPGSGGIARAWRRWTGREVAAS